MAWIMLSYPGMRTFLAVICTMAASGVAAAGECPEAQVVTYYKPAKLPAKIDTRCEIKDGKCTKLEMKGYLFPPSTTGSHKAPYPIIVFNHGSGPHPAAPCELGNYFAKHGFLVFAPIRRGVGISTGIDPGDYNKNYCSKKGDDGFCKMEYLRVQMQDVEEGVDFAKKQADVDPAQLVLMGHSFGGIVTTMANTRDMGQRAIVDFAGASQSWEGNADAVSVMKKNVQEAVAPIYFVEPLNDHSIAPTIELARVAGIACRQYESLLYPAIDVNGDGKIDKNDYDPVENRDKAHVMAMKATSEWGPAVLAFMNRYLTTPAKPFDHLCDGTSLILK